MLEIKNLSVEVEQKKILTDISLRFEAGRTYFLLGKNGSGKTSLSLALAGHPKYSAVSGSVRFLGEDLLSKTPEERAGLGFFLSLQNVPEIRGVKVFEYLSAIVNAKLKRQNPESKRLTPFVAKRLFQKEMKELGISESFLERELNVGFSGGEKRRLELLQMKLLDPKFIVLDEIDSGLDIDAFQSVVTLLSRLRSPDRTFLVVTHNFSLLDLFPPDEVVLLEKGRVKFTGDIAMAKKIGKEGFDF